MAEIFNFLNFGEKKEEKKIQEVLEFPIEIFWNLEAEILNKIFSFSKRFGLWNPEPKNTIKLKDVKFGFRPCL